MLAGVLAAGACAGGEADDNPGSASASADSGSAFPVTVEHKFGSTTIERAPEQVVSLGFNDQDSILAFGVKPVAVRYWYDDYPHNVFPWAQGALGGAEPVSLEMNEELDFEAIAALEPDLIIAVYSGITPDDYSRLAQIAPTIAQAANYIDYGMPWQDTTRLVGKSLGEEEQAEAMVAGLEAVFAQARADYPEFEGARVIVAGMRDDGTVGLFAEEDGRSRVLTLLGLELPSEVSGLFDDSFYVDIGAEQLRILDTADVVVWTQVVFAGGRQVIEEHPAYRTLRVAQEGRHVFLEGLDDDAFAFNSVLSLPYVLETFVPQLEAALDGDPATEAPGRGPVR